MKTTKTAIVALVISVGLLGACKDKEAGAGAEAGAPGAPQGPTCPEGFHKDPQDRFCIKVPADYKVGKEEKGAGWPRITIAKEGDLTGIGVVLAPADAYDMQMKARESMATGKGTASVERADIADGRGKLWRYKNTAVEMETVAAVVKGAQNVFICEGTWFESAPKPEIGDACKSLTLPK